jgi:hypothetical protein
VVGGQHFHAFVGVFTRTKAFSARSVLGLEFYFEVLAMRACIHSTVLYSMFGKKIALK